MNILGSNSRIRILRDMGFAIENFYFTLFLGGKNEKIFNNTAIFLGPFCPSLGKNKFSTIKVLRHFLVKLHAKNQRKLISQFW